MKDCNKKVPWASDSAVGAQMTKRCADLITRVFKRCIVVDRGYETECWEWTGANSGYGRGGGYGKISVNGESSYVHRVIWSCFNGYLPKTRQIDHLCRNRACCRPDHLEDVTNLENQRRKQIVYEEIAEGKR